MPSDTSKFHARATLSEIGGSIDAALATSLLLLMVASQFAGG
ncbi:MAG TPA: hypothetical protein VK638_16095 [Edaphobacter sp.]|nr:hypothetical protein [Edaphobacter sp.]